MSMIVYVLLSVTSHDNLIADAFTSLSLTIAFYYGITGFACVDLLPQAPVRQRQELLLHRCACPLHRRADPHLDPGQGVIDYSKPHCGYAKPFLGIGSPIAIALLTIILGLIGMIIQRVSMPEFFKRKASRSSIPRSSPTHPAGQSS